MKASLFVAATAFVCSAFAAPRPGSRHVRHERRDASKAVVKRDALDPTHLLPMRIGLTQSNLDRGHDLLMEVSDPKSSKYGQHYTVEEVHDIFAPSSEAVDAVRAWLEEAGIAAERVSQSTNKQWLQFDAETYEVEDLLQAQYHTYEHMETGKTSIGCDEYHVKESVQPHIDYITPGIKMLEFGYGFRKRSSVGNVKGGKPIKTAAPANVQFSATSLEYCDDYISPACIMAMYNISRATTAQKGNELGIFEETPEWLDQEDMDLFFTHLAPYIPNGTFPISDMIDGAKNRNNPKEAGGEALLDFQISYPLIYPQNSVFFLTDSDYEAFESPTYKVGLFNTFLDAIDGSYCTYSAFGEKGDNNTVDDKYPSKGYEHPLECGVFKPTNVISFSYELAEFNEGTSENYQKRQCNEYMKLGLQGVSLVFSSGDSGVETAFGCAGTEKKPIFNVNFPSNCPYVTSVGATTLIGKAVKDVERATTQFPSGGGFSNWFARPSYQESAVAAYFKSSEAPKYPYYTGSSFGNGIYNRSGRGYPDVSAIGQGVLNFGDGEPYIVGGTSASAPTFASILNRINEERLKAGKSTIGFVNPTLYQNPQAFNDITVGHNAGCGTDGFTAAPGWDPLTGLGTPDYPTLLDVFMKA